MTDLETVKENVSDLPIATQDISQLKGRYNQLTSELQKIKSLLEKLQKSIDAMQKGKEEYPPLPNPKPGKTDQQTQYSEAVKSKENKDTEPQLSDVDDKSVIDQSILDQSVNTEDENLTDESDDDSTWSVVSRKKRRPKSNKPSSSNRRANDKSRGSSPDRVRRYKSTSRENRYTSRLRSYDNIPYSYRRSQHQNSDYYRRDEKRYFRSKDQFRQERHLRNPHKAYFRYDRSWNHSPRRERRNSYTSTAYNRYQQEEDKYYDPSYIRHRNEKSCSFCGEWKHSTSQCWHKSPIKCELCGGSAHKAKMCHRNPESFI